VEEGGGEGKELHTNIATRGLMSRRKSSINRFRGIPPPHFPPSSTPSASRLSQRLDLGAVPSHLIFRCAANVRSYSLTTLESKHYIHSFVRSFVHSCIHSLTHYVLHT